MATYIKVAGELYPAEINGSMADYTWDGRESKSITLTTSHDEVAALLPDGTPWSIVQRTPAPDGSGTENRSRVGQQRVLALRRHHRPPRRHGDDQDGQTDRSRGRL